MSRQGDSYRSFKNDFINGKNVLFLYFFLFFFIWSFFKWISMNWNIVIIWFCILYMQKSTWLCLQPASLIKAHCVLKLSLFFPKCQSVNDSETVPVVFIILPSTPRHVWFIIITFIECFYHTSLIHPRLIFYVSETEDRKTISNNFFKYYMNIFFNIN